MQKYQREFVGEFIGTFLLVLFGCGSVAVSILFEAYQGILQIGLAWGIGVSLAIYATRHLSCAHLNPAVTIAMAVNKRMLPKKVPVYLLAQFLGAFAAGLGVYGLFAESIRNFEVVQGIVRGSNESSMIAKMFGEYYISSEAAIQLSMPQAMVAEGVGTFLLVFMIFSLTEGCNLGRPDNALTPIFIGLSVTSVICLIAPLTQAGLNPARDFGPRMVAWIFGWRQAAFPDKTGGFFFVYMLSPVIGAIVAGAFFTKVVQKLMQNKKEQSCAQGAAGCDS
ncbi:MAG: MIP/aquaporin family protein [Lachnospiraceae bacterium]